MLTQRTKRAFTLTPISDPYPTPDTHTLAHSHSLYSIQATYTTERALRRVRYRVSRFHQMFFRFVMSQLSLGISAGIFFLFLKAHKIFSSLDGSGEIDNSRNYDFEFENSNVKNGNSMNSVSFSGNLRGSVRNSYSSSYTNYPNDAHSHSYAHSNPQSHSYSHPNPQYQSHYQPHYYPQSNPHFQSQSYSGSHFQSQSQSYSHSHSDSSSLPLNSSSSSSGSYFNLNFNSYDMNLIAARWNMIMGKSEFMFLISCKLIQINLT